ncbi:hypothetical protein FPV67DRAFT_1372386, partial [Lyophyllum atratum]
NLSPACTQALTTIATSPDANACLTPSPLLAIASDPSKSIVDPINNWLTSLCAAPSCSNATLAAIVTNATTGCAMELGALGFQAGDASAVTAVIQGYYPTARKVVCLKDGNTNCVTQTLTNLQTLIGPLSIENIIKVASSDFFANTTIPANLTCTNCIKAAYNTINTDVPGFLGNGMGVQQQCGASFTDGATPSGISQSAANVNATGTQGSGALSFNMLSGASLLVAVTSGFAI